MYIKLPHGADLEMARAMLNAYSFCDKPKITIHSVRIVGGDCLDVALARDSPNLGDDAARNLLLGIALREPIV